MIGYNNNKLMNLMDRVGDNLSNEEVIQHFLNWLPTATAEECLEDLLIDNDIEF